MASTYYPHIDGLRAIAVLFVLLYHAGVSFIPGGFVGVDVFFVISGFLITSQLIEQFKSRNFSFKEFYVRRFRRLIPAYLSVSMASIVVAFFILMPDDFISYKPNRTWVTFAWKFLSSQYNRRVF